MRTSSADGKFSWEEVQCLGACATRRWRRSARTTTGTLTAEGFAGLLDAFARGEVPRPGPQNGRFASEPLGGVTSLAGERTTDDNASVTLAERLGDTVARITGNEPSPRTAVGRHAQAARIDPAERSDHGPAVAPSRPAGSPRRGGRGRTIEADQGVGPVLEGMLDQLGYFHFFQIAAWTPEEVASVDEKILKGFMVASPARAGWSKRASWRRRAPRPTRRRGSGTSDGEARRVGRWQ